MPQLLDPQRPGRIAVSYQPTAATVRTDTHRLILHKGGAVELYDHTSPELETRNIAEDTPEIVLRLQHLLQARLPAWEGVQPN